MEVTRPERRAADLFGQGDFDIRFDWGPTGAKTAHADVSVIVDVLSFSTSVTIAVERGIRVFPFRWRAESAEEYAAQHDAILAVGRIEATSNGTVATPSLSPTSLLACEAVPRLVLPSPNGSTIAAVLQDSGSTTAVGCLRNARAVAWWLAPMLEAGKSIAIIAAGERWGDGSLRPALEDQFGAGAILSEVLTLGHQDRLSPEALVTAEVFRSGRSHLAERIAGCVSGRELVSKGFRSDVDIAGELNASTIVPVLADGAFCCPPPAGSCGPLSA